MKNYEFGSKDLDLTPVLLQTGCLNEQSPEPDARNTLPPRTNFMFRTEVLNSKRVSNEHGVSMQSLPSCLHLSSMGGATNPTHTRSDVFSTTQAGVDMVDFGEQRQPLHLMEEPSFQNCTSATPYSHEYFNPCRQHQNARKEKVKQSVKRTQSAQQDFGYSPLRKVPSSVSTQRRPTVTGHSSLN